MPDEDFAESLAAVSGAWESLRQFTPARLAVGLTGHSQPTAATLAFNLAHAHARDAVYTVLDGSSLRQSLEGRGLAMVSLQSRATDRRQYLQRPDLGRRLDEVSVELLTQRANDVSVSPDVVIILADGLSAAAVNHHAVPLLDHLLPHLRGCSLAPVALVAQGRVALSDEVGQLLGARLALILLGERPGLSAPDSLGAYLTFAPRVGLTDEARNCVSNVRPEGLGYAAAAGKLAYLIHEALRRGLTGVGLKDEAPRLE